MVEEVFKNLVDQFSDPFTCLRELVQNAMDAGTEHVEVRTRYLSDPGGVCLEIRDFGEGMDRDIIDGKLTRLFSSDKENDLTKIGKFGIGFVSVFSLRPELVTVDTGRDGEYWRIAFDGGTDFQLFKLHAPLEGTSVKLFKLLPYEELEEFERRCQETVSRWCRHSHVQISFNDQSINRPLVVDSCCRVSVQEGLGSFNVGLTTDSPSRFGLYNTGLTLTEGEQEQFTGITFKILSNHLEHTLTRDAVIVDENYHKVMNRLNEIIHGPLFDSTCEQLLGEPELREKTAAVAASYLVGISEKLNSAQSKRPFLKDLFDNPVSWSDLAKTAKEENHFFVTEQESDLARRAVREGIPVFGFSRTSQTAALLSSLFEVPVVSLERNLAVSRPVPRPPGLKKVESHIRWLLREARILVRAVVPVEYPDTVSLDQTQPCTFALGPDRLVRRFRRGFWATKYLLPQQLLLDINHPLIRKALSRAESPGGARLAAYIICKAALLNDGLDPGVESRLLKTLLERS